MFKNFEKSKYDLFKSQSIIKSSDENQIKLKVLIKK